MIEKVFKLIKDYYKIALKNPYVKKKLSWAVYQAWKEVDRIEK